MWEWFGDQGQSGHPALGCARLEFAKNLEILTGGSARNPADLEPPAIGLFHHIEPLGVEVENRKPGRQRVQKGLVTCGADGLVELLASNI
jgi:hypothetical protein